MKFIINILKGLIVGIANIIPGVSGGTMAVSMGIYDKMLTAVSSLFKKFKESFKFLLPLGIGMILGIGGFTFILSWLLENQPFATAVTFTGLILGGLPIIFKCLKAGWDSDKNKSLIINILIFVIFAAVSIILPQLGGSKDSGVLLVASLPMVFKAFGLGVVVAATMAIPGVSGSLVLMVLGYYFGILSSVKTFISALKDFDIAAMFDEALILAPFAIGCLTGIFFISKLIAWLLKNFTSATYCGILGLVITSPFSVFYKVAEEYSMKGTSVPTIIVSTILFVIFFGVAFFMGKLDHGEDSVETSKEENTISAE